MELKHFRLHDVKADDDARTVEGWASTFGNVDSDDDIILPGAFADSIRDRMPKMCWQHDSTQIPGVWTEANETPQGLYVKGRLLGTTLGNDAYELLKAGAIDRMSIGYSAKDFNYDTATGVRTLKQIDLWEVSLVTFPANDMARITSVKSKPANERQLEEYLREAGYSRSEAKGLIAKGYKAIANQREVDAQALSTSLHHAINILKGSPHVR